MQYRYVAPLPFVELPRWEAKNVLPLNLIALPFGACIALQKSADALFFVASEDIAFLHMI